MIETERLTLYSVPPPLVALLAGDEWHAARATAPPYDFTDQTFVNDKAVLARRHFQLIADPAEEPWLYRVAVLRDTRQVIGRVGFHAPPDTAGMVEIGYRVAEPYRRQGLAVEMAGALIAWGASHGASRCLASVRPDNAASLRTIARLGFVKVGEQVDEVDGLEWVHQLDLGAPVHQLSSG